MQEFDISFHHNILVKRKKRLLILMSLDRPSDLYANDASDTAALRQYLRLYAYIDYRAEDWLDKLLYALPVRGLLRRGQNEWSERSGNGEDNQALLMDSVENTVQYNTILQHQSVSSEDVDV